MVTSDMIVVFPANPTPDLARTLDLGGYRWKAVSGADEAGKCEPQAGWMGAIITCDEDPENAWAFARALRSALEFDPRALGVIPSTKGSL